MIVDLTPQQREAQAAFRAFVDDAIVPDADRWDREERLPIEVLRQLGRRGYLGAMLPTDAGGTAVDAVTYGLLHEELGRGCSSVRSAVTVQDMVAHALLRWGRPEHKRDVVPQLARGDRIAAFALTEPNVGSDAQQVETTARREGDQYVLTGHKRWITCGAIADLFLVVARTDEGPAAFLVERGTAGLTTTAVGGLLGCRASMLADVALDGCRVSGAQLVGRPGFGFSHVAGTALDHGRYTVAWGAVGIGQAALEASLGRAGRRHQFGAALASHQLVQRMVADMVVGVRAARLLCWHAGRLREAGDPNAILETSAAKYYASTVAARASADAVQIHGAVGCSAEASVQRYFRDAKIMEIIEGSSQIQQIAIARDAFQRTALARPDRAVTRPAVKCVVWDLDRTLWDGVLLEDDAVSPRPEAVEAVKALDARGILQSIASRNDPERAVAVLRRLGLEEYFLYPQIHWGAKSASIQAIARALNIGVDAVAFLDDEAFERAEVESAVAGVLCLDGRSLEGLLERPELSPRFVTAESRERRRMYLADQRRAEAEAAFQGPSEAFLASLGMRLTIRRAQADDLQRAEELTVRTHQLNSTGRTYSYADLDRLRRSPAHRILIVRLEDRFGSYGTIGLALVDCADRAWTLKLLLMSCRVMSRGVGAILLNHVVGEAQASGAVLRAEFVPTDVNRMMYVTYKFAGFREVGREGDASVLEHDGTPAPPPPTYVTVIVEDAPAGAGLP